uniref:Arrestin_C domain-containing protein n=1 Tax=Heterorhabditis bacteriophora TaxID=37862 RepID=A0A1I7WUR9_HETBA
MFYKSTLEAKVVVHNRTRKCLKDCALQLTMKAQYEARSRYEHVNEKRLSENLIELISLGKVRARQKQEFEKSVIHIPDGIPPTQNYHREGGDTAIITIQYVLKLTAIPGIECEIPLIITSRGYQDSSKQAAFLLHSYGKSTRNDNFLTSNIVQEKLIVLSTTIVMPKCPKEYGEPQIKKLWSKSETRLWSFTLFVGTSMLYAARVTLPICAVSMAKEYNWNKTDSVAS